jgi:hypothetical protein
MAQKVGLRFLMRLLLPKDKKLFGVFLQGGLFVMSCPHKERAIVGHTT